MSKYVIEFSKTGTICYTSHLDVMRMFKRAFKRAGIALSYSQGFNPHPKMGFAQPLSLGYEAEEEFIEFETPDDREPADLLEALRSTMPEGIDLKRCERQHKERKTLSSMTCAAIYEAVIPLHGKECDVDGQIGSYLAQDRIVTLKKQKKKKELKEVDIKPMIRQITGAVADDELVLEMLMDQGSTSNLSPELILSTFMTFAGIDTDRSEVRVKRKKILFTEDPFQ